MCREILSNSMRPRSNPPATVTNHSHPPTDRPTHQTDRPEPQDIRMAAKRYLSDLEREKKERGMLNFAKYGGNRFSGE